MRLVHWLHSIAVHNCRVRTTVRAKRQADNAACPRPRDLCLTNCDNLPLQKDVGFRQIAIHSFVDWPSCTGGFVKKNRRTSRTLIDAKAKQ
jgi:hypothetical protein